MQQDLRTFRHSGHARQLALAGAWLLSTLVWTGCGPRAVPLEKLYPVEGQVMLNGKPLPGAGLTFRPKSVGKANPLERPVARGVADESGKFTLGTYGGQDGAAPGDYQVTIVLNAPPEKENVPGRNLLPAKYAGFETSGLIATVGESPTKLPTFDLVVDAKSAGDQAAAPPPADQPAPKKPVPVSSE